MSRRARWRSDRPGSRPSRLGLRALSLVAGFLAGCTPTSHTVGGADYTAARLRHEVGEAADACRATGHAVPDRPFTTDGCTLWPDAVWQSCCVEHDRRYWCGGTARERREADRALRACVERAGHPRAGTLMYWGSRIGGHPWLPVPWRWGYGWDWPRGYETAEASAVPPSGGPGATGQ